MASKGQLHLNLVNFMAKVVVAPLLCWKCVVDNDGYEMALYLLEQLYLADQTYTPEQKEEVLESELSYDNDTS